MDKYQDLQELIATSELGFAGTRHIDACLGETNPVSNLTAAPCPQRREQREIGTEPRGAPLQLGSGQENERNHVSERTSMQSLNIQSPTVRRFVREEIQRRILSGESRPGERVAQQSLAKELGVGQGSVREALVELQWLGLVDSVDRLGVFVGNLDAARLCEAYEIREFLEGLAARRACEHAS
jgi:DNA-binding transcriptional regulator YhcF (GntR family)